MSGQNAIFNLWVVHILYFRKLGLLDGITVKEDLPVEVRKAHSILLKKKSEALANGFPDEGISTFISKKIRILPDVFDAKDDLQPSQSF